MTPLRICFVTTFYPPFNFGGDGIVVQRLARGVARRGHDVTVVHDADAYAVLAHGARPRPESPDPTGIQVVTLSGRLPRLSTLLTHQIGYPVVNRRRLRLLLEGGRFDAIVFNNVSLIGGPGLLGYGGDSATVYMSHEHWLVCPTHVLWRHQRERCDAKQCLRCQLHYRRPPQLWRHTGLLARQLEHIDVFIAMSKFSREKHREFGFPREMEVMPCVMPDPSPRSGIDDCPRPRARPYFLFVGRLERIKGLEDAIAAFAQYQDADLVVVGDGEHGAELRRLAAGNRRVHFVGRVPVDDLSPYYRHAIAVVIPSVGYETFGMTAIEAFSHQTPVIARRLGPFPDLIQESGGGELFATVPELLASLRAVQSSPGRREALGRAGYKAYLHRWSEGAVVPRFLDIVERARARRAARPH
jgi:glycosyltransferase involved in cell wall biosynthesis